jgi:hypothetical protein
LITAARALTPPLRALSYATLIALMATTGLRRTLHPADEIDREIARRVT